MMTWIARWFGAEARDARSTPAAAPPVAAAAIPAHAGAAGGGDEHEIDRLFYRWLTGAGEQDTHGGSQKLILDELARLTRSPDAADLVPRVPAVIPRLLRSLRDDSVSGADLSRQLSQDVVLVAEVIREANSPYYRSSTPIRTIEGAILQLGQNGLRMLLARVAFRPIISMQSGLYAKQVAPQLWSQAELCANAASMLAGGQGANPFEAYLASLMQNVGLIVAFRLADQICTNAPLPQSEQFADDLQAAARALSARIAALWDFPRSVVGAIEQAHDAHAPALAQVVGHADRISKLRMLVDAGQLAAEHPLVAGLDPGALTCFDKLQTREE